MTGNPTLVSWNYISSKELRVNIIKDHISVFASNILTANHVYCCTLHQWQSFPKAYHVCLDWILSYQALVSVDLTKVWKLTWNISLASSFCQRWFIVVWEYSCEKGPFWNFPCLYSRELQEQQATIFIYLFKHVWALLLSLDNISYSKGLLVWLPNNH